MNLNNLNILYINGHMQRGGWIGEKMVLTVREVAEMLGGSWSSGR